MRTLYESIFYLHLRMNIALYFIINFYSKIKYYLEHLFIHMLYHTFKGKFRL